MRTRIRLGIVAGFLGLVGFLTWLIANHATPGQALSLSVLVDTGTEAVRTVDRIGKLATEMPLGEEVKVGDGIARDLEAGFSGWANAKAQEREQYVAMIAKILVEQGGLRRPGMPYVAKVMDSSEINAFAIPGGHVYITTGMLDHLKSEAELAAILGHEIAHVDLKHCIERIQYEHAARKLGGAPLEVMVGIGTQLATIGFSDDLEKEADRTGTLFAEKAGYHPQGGQVVFARLKALLGERDENRNTLGAEVTGMLGDALNDYFRTHPSSGERILAYDRVFREQGFDLDHHRYYVGSQNYADLKPRSSREYAYEWVEGRIYP